jgi:hypothetical protein
MECIKDIRQEQRPDVVSHLARWTYNERDFMKKWIIERITNIPHEQRADFVSHVAGVINDQIDGMRILPFIIILIRSIPHEQRADVVRNFLEERAVNPELPGLAIYLIRRENNRLLRSRG